MEESGAKFYLDYIDWPWASPSHWPIITPTWNHLWYVLYVVVYTAIIVCLGWLTGDALERLRIGWSPYVTWVSVLAIQIGLMLALYGSVGAAQTLYGDWYNLTASFLIMLFGYVIAKDSIFWDALKSLRVQMLILAVGLSFLVIVAEQLDWPRQISLVIRLIQGWAVIWALLGWGQVLLRKPSPLLHYLSGAVFTYYILHQTIIIMLGVPLMGFGLSVVIEITLLTVGTLAACWAGYELVARRIGIWGILLGVRRQHRLARGSAKGAQTEQTN